MRNGKDKGGRSPAHGRRKIRPTKGQKKNSAVTGTFAGEGEAV